MLSSDLTTATILVVDDEEANVDLLEGFLAEGGYRNVVSTRDPREVLRLWDEHEPDLVLLDLHMPYLDGFAVLEQLTARTPEDSYIPILVLTADITAEAKQRALSGGAKDFLTKPLDDVEVQLRIHNLLQTRYLYLLQRKAREAAEAAERRAGFLAEASRVLGSSFDYHTALASVARLAVPLLADYCVIDMLDGERGSVRPGLAHATPELEPVLNAGTHPGAGILPFDSPQRQALLEGDSVLIGGEAEAESLVSAAEGDERELFARLRPQSSVSVPLLASGRVLGSLSLASAESGRQLGSEDLALAEELARRITLALENAQLYDQALQATRARDEILGIVAHDLRNPLSTIRMGTEMLLEELRGTEHASNLNIVHRSADRMNRLIQDLLEVTRIESGKLSLDPRPENLASLFAEALAMLKPLAAARSIELDKEINGDIPPVLVDNARLLQVISNLVGNAIKFTPAGGRIQMRAELSGQEVRCAIQDTGPGIPPEQLPHIFGRFWQARSTDRRGIGLGLSIARGIVDAHGGRIWVESTLGEGSTFYFTVPRAGNADPAGAQLSALEIVGAPIPAHDGAAS